MINKTFASSTVALVSMLVLGSALAFGHQRSLPKLAADAAPQIVGDIWLNTQDGKPVTLESRAGKPTLVAFWTFACSNCQANMPAYARILAKYRTKGVEMISVHTPEMRIERDVEQVKKHVQRFGIDYPVVIDGENTNWNRWHVRYWPTLFVLDGKGRVVRYWEGELNWKGAPGEKEVGQTLDGLLGR